MDEKALLTLSLGEVLNNLKRETFQCRLHNGLRRHSANSFNWNSSEIPTAQRLIESFSKC
jgi:hypothetical protein